MNPEVHLEKLIKYIEEENFMGYDPYDALNSPILRLLSFNKKKIRIAFIQFLRRFPLNMRPVLGIKKEYNPKALGLFLWGYVKLFRSGRDENHLKKIDLFLEWLKDMSSKEYSGCCWGYNFDWQSRAFYIPKFTPTLVNSSFIGHALIDTFIHTGRQEAMEMAIGIKDFILNDLNRKEENGRICFSYSPVDSYYVHNANLLGASLLIRIYKYTDDNSVKETALSCLEYTMKYQRPGGSWYYSEDSINRKIDSFHTGFNLQSILYFLKEGYRGEYASSFENGVKFYEENFFMEDGTPKYYHDRTYPLDIHSASQAVVFFSFLGDTHRKLAKNILTWMINNLQEKKGYFYYQKGRFFKNKIPYMRWSQAWAFHALTSYLHPYD